MFGRKEREMNKNYLDRIQLLINDLDPTNDDFDDRIYKLGTLFPEALENITGEANKKYIDGLHDAYLDFKEGLTE